MKHKKSLSQKLHSFARDIVDNIEYRGIVYALTPTCVRDFIRAIKDYFYYRYNVIKISTLSFHYHDPVEVLLHANFQVLTNFVEKELIPSFYGEPPLFDLVKEERQLREDYGQGIDKEDAEKFIQQSLDSLKRQNESTQEMLDLYNWWKNRENRKWPEYHGKRCYYGTSCKGIGELNKCGDYDMYETVDSDGTEEEKIKHKVHMEEWAKVDDAYEKEDDDMLNRLVKIRRHLWT